MLGQMHSDKIDIDLVKNQVEANLKQSFDWLYSEQTGSTNSDLLALKKPNTIAITEHQTLGRGQRKNTWQSKASDNLLFSIALQTSFTSSTGLIPLKVGLAVKSALNQLGYHAIHLKWPNDIFYHGKKLGGILVESITQSNSTLLVVVGVGLNINMPHYKNSPFISLRKTELLDRSPILAQCLSNIVKSIQQDKREIVDDFNKSNLFQLKTITFNHDKGQSIGICQGINELGQLLIQTDRQLEAHSTGRIEIDQHALS